MKALVLLAAVLLAGCPTPAPQPPPSPPDASDAAPAPPTPAAADSGVVLVPACVTAQDTLLRLGCKDARGRLIGGPNEHGVSFAAVCTDTFGKGIDVHANCITVARDCAGVSSCSR